MKKKHMKTKFTLEKLQYIGYQCAKVLLLLLLYWLDTILVCKYDPVSSDCVQQHRDKYIPKLCLFIFQLTCNHLNCYYAIIHLIRFKLHNVQYA